MQLKFDLNASLCSHYSFLCAYIMYKAKPTVLIFVECVYVWTSPPLPSHLFHSQILEKLSRVINFSPQILRTWEKIIIIKFLEIETKGIFNWSGNYCLMCWVIVIASIAKIIIFDFVFIRIWGLSIASYVPFRCFL